MEKEKTADEVRKRDVKRLTKIFGINLLLMFSTGVSGVKLDNYAAIADSGHEASDASVMAGRAVVEKKQVEEKKWFQNYRKISYSIVFGVSAIIAFKSSLELIDLLQGASQERSLQERAQAIGNAALVAGGNRIAYSISQDLEGESDNVEDAKHHAIVDWRASKKSAAFIAIGAFVPFVTEIGGAYVGGFTAWHMRPTKANLESHSHSRDD
jgi:hypothetical protein